MYQSLYRKYRPQLLDDIVGQDVIIKILKNQILNSRISHAYLFTGPRGTGKTSVAKILGKTVNCLNLKNAKPCNKCVCCTQNKNNQSIDILEIDAASNNGVDEIRELRNKVSLVPTLGKYKIYIIDEVHMLSSGAFNALLKTLEEPPEHVIFILATTELHKIPATILSRCQKFDFKRISKDNIVKRLQYICKQENIKISIEPLNEIARLSAGGLRDAIGMLEQVLAYSNENITLEDVHSVNGTLPFEELKELVNYIIDQDLEQIFKKIEEYDLAGKNFYKLLEELILFLKNIIIFQKVPNFNEKDISREIYEVISKKITLNEVIEKIKKINNLFIDLKQYSDPKLIMELILINLTDKPIKTKNIIENIKPIQNKKEKTKKTIIEPSNKNNFDEVIKTLKDIRVNNTLVEPKRNILDKIKEEMKKIKSYFLSSNYSHVASLLIDTEVRAASSTNLILVTKNDKLAMDLNYKIAEIEKFLEHLLKNKYKVVVVGEIEWLIYRENYQKTLLNNKKYIYKEEPIYIKNFIEEQKNKNKNNIERDFNDIIEYI